MIEQEIQKLGLSQRESKVYVTLLELGESTVGPISKQSKIAVPKIYPTLEKLEEKGLVSFIIKSKTKYFNALDPKNLIRPIKEKEELFNQLLPKLKILQEKSIERTSAEIFQGYAGMKALFEDIITNITKDDFYYVFAYKEQYKNIDLAKNFLKHFHERLQKIGVEDRLIANESVKEEVKKNFEYNDNIKISFLDFDVPIGLIITNKFVVISNWNLEPINIRIQSEDIAKQYKQFFHSMWDLGKE